MTQRKISNATATRPGATKAVAAEKARHRSASPGNQYLTRFQESLLRGSTPGPVTQRSDCDPHQALDQMHEYRNRLRSWSYKGAGI